MVVAAIAAAEHRQVMTIDVGGAFLNADITTTGIDVHVRLDPVMTNATSTIAATVSCNSTKLCTDALRLPLSGSTI